MSVSSYVRALAVRPFLRESVLYLNRRTPSDLEFHLGLAGQSPYGRRSISLRLRLHHQGLLRVRTDL